MPSDTIRILSFSRSSDRTYCMPSERSVVFGCAIPLPCQLSVANRQQSHRPRRNPVRPPRMQGATPEKTRSPPLSRRSGRIRPSACARSIRRPQRRTSGPPTGNVTTDFNRAARSSSDNGCRHPTCRSAETPVHRSACSDRLVHSSATIRRHLPSAAAAHLRCAALPSRT